MEGGGWGFDAYQSGTTSEKSTKLATETENQLKEISEEDALEPWADWIQRATHKVEEQARKLNLQSWVLKARAAKWKWAFRVANHNANRWTCQVFSWDPELLFDGRRSQAQRNRGRPQLRWIDDMVQLS